MSQKESGKTFDKQKELCFDENEFLKDSFSIDNFLRDHRNKASLEVMRDDLGTYLKSLRLSMIELINKDYEDFVNLSKDLIGLDNGINHIQVPLQQLREEVLQVKNDLEETISGLHDCLEQRRQLREKKRSLLHLTQVIASITKLKSIVNINHTDDHPKSLNLDLVERAAMEYNQLQFSMSKCKDDLLPNHKKNAEEIGQVLINILNNMFLECLCEKHLEDLSRCLRLFASLDKIQDVEKLVRNDIIAPVLHEIINETNMQKEPQGLKSIYLKVLNFLDVQLKDLLDLTNGSNKTTIRGFNFIQNSFWPEFERRLELHVSSIFAPGNPELFHSRFRESMIMIDELEQRCGNQTAVMTLREHEQYQHFFQKWNLPVYFKIRFQEIAGQFELILAEEEKMVTVNGGKDVNSFSLKASVNVMKSLERCWSSEVYLTELSHMFWKLSLQILSRYITWVQEVLVQDVESAEKKKLESEPSLPNTSTELQLQSRLDFLVCLFSDTTKIKTDAKSYLEKCKEKIPNRDLIEEQLTSSLNTSIQAIEDCLPKITESIVKVIVSESVVHLRQVSDIPRLFRRTNRETPTKPCDYIGNVLLLPTKFYNSKKNFVPDEVLQSWLTFVFNEITMQFYSCVNEVLTNAQKTEESLRKLKKIKDKYYSSADNKNNDDDKIRQQLVVDVHSFSNGADSVQVNRNDVKMLKDLVNLVESARDRSERQ